MLFENYAEKIPQVQLFLHKHGLSDLENAKKLCESYNLDIFQIVKKIQPIAFDDVCWAYIAGSAAVLKEGICTPTDIALLLGEGLQSFCLPGSVADSRDIGNGHGRLASMILSEKTSCFAFLAGHESFAAAEGAISIIGSANKIRKFPLRVILNGLGKNTAFIISRINGFTYVATSYDHKTEKLYIENEFRFSNDNLSAIRCYGANDIKEGVAIMKHENVDISISGNGTNMVRFTHLVAGIYKRYCTMIEKPYFACASGGGIGRTLGPDETSAGPVSYGLTDSMSQMYGDAIFAGSSSVPAHVAMMGYVGMGNNPMVGATVSIAAELTQINQNRKDLII